MYKVLLDNIEDSREEFEALHNPTADYYGGAEVASICGVGWQSPLDLWLQKTGKKRTETPLNDQMLLGQLLEKSVMTLLSARLKSYIRPINQVWQSVSYPWYIGSPDAEEVGEDNLIEIKTGRIYALKYWSESMASDSAICQLQWYLGLDDKKKGGYCAALIGGDTENFFYPYFERDQEFIDQLFDRVSEFRELVKKDLPPRAGAGDADLIRDHILKEYPEKKEIDLTESHLILLREYSDLESDKKDLKPKLDKIESRQKAIKNQFLADSAGASLIKVGEGFVKLSHIVTDPHEVKGSDYYRITVKGVNNG